MSSSVEKRGEPILDETVSVGAHTNVHFTIVPRLVYIDTDFINKSGYTDGGPINTAPRLGLVFAVCVHSLCCGEPIDLGFCPKCGEQPTYPTQYHLQLRGGNWGGDGIFLDKIDQTSEFALTPSNVFDGSDFYSYLVNSGLNGYEATVEENEFMSGLVGIATMPQVWAVAAENMGFVMEGEQ